jgi:hypothetical protein
MSHIRNRVPDGRWVGPPRTVERPAHTWFPRQDVPRDARRAAAENCSRVHRPRLGDGLDPGRREPKVQTQASHRPDGTATAAVATSVHAVGAAPDGSQAADQASGRLPWCIDVDTRHNVVARRNVLAGLWAGRQMGLGGASLTAFASDLHFSSRDDDALIAHLARDLGRFDVSVSTSELREMLTRFHRVALHQTCATD